MRLFSRKRNPLTERYIIEKRVGGVWKIIHQHLIDYDYTRELYAKLIEDAGQDACEYQLLRVTTVSDVVDCYSQKDIV